MEDSAKAILRFTRVAPRKARAVVDLIRGRQVGEAIQILKYTPRHAAKVVEKVLYSAIANAGQKELGDADDLTVARAFVDPGPIYKRSIARSMGRANPIKKRTSHITIVVQGRDPETSGPKKRGKSEEGNDGS